MAPVGVWAIEGDRPESYYPPENERFRERGWNALTAQPGLPLEEWARFKASSSPAWRLHDDIATVGLERDVAGAVVLAALFESIRAEHEQMAAWHQDAASLEHHEPAAPHSAAAQFVLTASWRIASELTRRRPEVVVHEMHTGGGTYDVLLVARPEDLGFAGSGVGARVMLNRAGSLQVHRGHHDQQKVADWSDVLLHPGIHEVIDGLQEVAGWPTASSASATARSLSYRFIAAALQLLGGGRHLWDARSESVDSSGVAPRRLGLIDGFPSVFEEEARRDGSTKQPYSRFWVLLRGDEAVAVVTTEGRLHRRSRPPVDLLAAYAKHNRRIRRMTAALLNSWM